MYCFLCLQEKDIGKRLMFSQLTSNDTKRWMMTSGMYPVSRKNAKQAVGDPSPLARHTKEVIPQPQGDKGLYILNIACDLSLSLCSETFFLLREQQMHRDYPMDEHVRISTSHMLD